MVTEQASTDANFSVRLCYAMRVVNALAVVPLRFKCPVETISSSDYLKTIAIFQS